MGEKPSTDLWDMLVRHEGLRLKPYRCPAGRLTIGVGRNLEDKGISSSEAFNMLANDIVECEDDLKKVFPSWNEYRKEIQYALINVRFNVGPSGFPKFVKLIAAVKAYDFYGAAYEIIDSKLAPKRAQELAGLMRRGAE